MTTITKERLQWLANISGRDDIDDIDGGEIRELALIALASLEAELMVYQYRLWDTEYDEWGEWEDCGECAFEGFVEEEKCQGQVFRPVSYTPYHRYQLYRMDWLKQCASMNRLSMKIRQSKLEHGKTPLTGYLKRLARLLALKWYLRQLPLAFASKEKMTLVLRINRKCLASTLHPAGCCNKHFCTG